MENTNEISEKNISEFDINDIVKLTYTRIAEWHNNEANTVSLKHLSLDLVEDIAGRAFKHLGLNYTPAIWMDEETKKKVEMEKQKNSNTSAKPVDQMTDEELLEEIKKRKTKNI